MIALASSMNHKFPNFESLYWILKLFIELCTRIHKIQKIDLSTYRFSYSTPMFFALIPSGDSSLRSSHNLTPAPQTPLELTNLENFCTAKTSPYIFPLLNNQPSPYALLMKKKNLIPPITPTQNRKMHQVSHLSINQSINDTIDLHITSQPLPLPPLNLRIRLFLRL